jgi:ornithine carbamoyltransferase
MNVNSPGIIEPSAIRQIITGAESVLQSGFDLVSKRILKPFVIGSVFHGASAWDSRIAGLTAARLGCYHISFPAGEGRAMSSEETISHLEDLSQSVDILLASYVDRSSFGAGHLLVERLCSNQELPIVWVRDELFAYQPGLAELLGLSHALHGLEKRRIVISWGFGSQFALPNTAQCLLLFALSMGCNVRVVNPPKFPLLKRVAREARDIVKSSGVEFEETQEFESSFKDADAVFALNWCRLDDLNHPERFPAYASEFKDWYFDTETLPEGCIFSSEYPVETDLLVAPRVARGNRSVVSSWLSRRTSTLAASIDWVLQTCRSRIK